MKISNNWTKDGCPTDADGMPQLAPNNESNTAHSEEEAVVSAAVENKDILTSMAVDET